MTKKIMILALCISFSSVALCKVKTESTSKKLLKKVLAENSIFRCSFNQALESSLKGEKLKKQIKKKCQTEVKKIGQWYKDKSFTSRADLLISNGIKSAHSHKVQL